MLQSNFFLFKMFFNVNAHNQPLACSNTAAFFVHALVTVNAWMALSIKVSDAGLTLPTIHTIVIRVIPHVTLNRPQSYNGNRQISIKPSSSLIALIKSLSFFDPNMLHMDTWNTMWNNPKWLYSANVRSRVKKKTFSSSGQLTFFKQISNSKKHKLSRSISRNKTLRGFCRENTRQSLF